MTRIEDNAADGRPAGPLTQEEAATSPEGPGEVEPSREPVGVALPFAVLGAIAMGAVAVGAAALGAVAVGRLSVRSARIRRLEIDKLVIRDQRDS